MNTTRGGRNLAILGFGAVIFTAATTIVSLAMYRASGDIYLDRSRPGFLPDEDEVNEDPVASPNFSFSENGDINREDLDQYLTELKKIDERLSDFSDPFSPMPLSDESLGIPSEFEE